MFHIDETFENTVENHIPNLAVHTKNHLLFLKIYIKLKFCLKRYNMNYIKEYIYIIK